MEDNKTVFYASQNAGAATKTASLLLIDARRSTMMVSLSGNMTIGRERPGATAKLRFSATNGTYINGRQLLSVNGQNPGAYRLADGDVFSCVTFSRWGMHAVGSIAGL